jgi:hypothetical protein
MAAPLLCLVGYALWAILLVLYVGGQRAFQVVTGKKAPNAFPSGVQHGSDAYWRANRAHINATENLPSSFNGVPRSRARDRRPTGFVLDPTA